ncbi:hypothetical protein EVAR_65430_1 [Eumeta japonica]|uniref:Uncharacterized protein n=1 Tax=Eumeta variegata TaxID=151549 RepID=A0A4C1YI80_EUMVA|nr:hypothetical protein EVAR_65430_1 [Eumeta japonica]
MEAANEAITNTQEFHRQRFRGQLTLASRLNTRQSILGETAERISSQSAGPAGASRTRLTTESRRFHVLIVDSTLPRNTWPWGMESSLPLT